MHPRYLVVPDQPPVQFPERTLFADQDFAWRDDPDHIAVKQGCAEQEASEQQRKKRGDAKPTFVRQMTETRQGDQAQE